MYSLRGARGKRVVQVVRDVRDMQNMRATRGKRVVQGMRSAQSVQSIRVKQGKRGMQNVRVARGMRGARRKQLVRLDALGPCVHVLNANQARHLHGAALFRKLGAGRGDVVLLDAVREEHHAAFPVAAALHIADAR